jgi:hypothetical protein
VDAAVVLSFPSIDQAMNNLNLILFEKETSSFLSVNTEYPGFSIMIESVTVVS